MRRGRDEREDTGGSEEKGADWEMKRAEANSRKEVGRGEGKTVQDDGKTGDLSINYNTIEAVRCSMHRKSQWYDKEIGTDEDHGDLHMDRDLHQRIKNIDFKKSNNEKEWGKENNGGNTITSTLQTS